MRSTRIGTGGWLALLAVLGGLGPASATQLQLKDGRTLTGKLAMLTGLSDKALAAPGGQEQLQLIVMLDDDLRRTFVPKGQVRAVLQEEGGETKEKFVLRQRVMRAGKSVKTAGTIARQQPFDEFGHRILTMNTVQGPVDIVQGITEITPEWTKVEGISHMWDMRMATSSIHPDVLRSIFRRLIDAKNIEQRKRVARFYIQSERYEEAVRELDGVVKDFADNQAAVQQLAPTLQALRQMQARRILGELKLRQGAGQHGMVAQALAKFPSEGVAGEVLQAVKEMLDGTIAVEKRRLAIVTRIRALLDKIDPTTLREQLRPMCEEIVAELNVNTMARMTSFAQNMDDAAAPAADKLALALSGWLQGSDAATVRLPVAMSAFRTRDAVRRYLREPVKIQRTSILASLGSEEAGIPPTVAQLLAHMKPPVETPTAAPARPGYYELDVVLAGLDKESSVRYYVQLPPEYDPYRRYPAVVTLHAAGMSPEMQVDWWAGQASRHGYIVIAPAWAVEHQNEYRYSAREHAAVLNCLRDACRRFSIDTDRVFLSGYSMGGDAAWDLGLAHPDLWAGVIPIVSRADKYCTLYWQNAKLVPWYFIGGELDVSRMLRNASEWERYLRTAGFNVTTVEYQGRGHEDFSDEIQRVFDWMGRFRREFYPREFTCSTMRPWDNYFWWVELQGLPPRSMVDPGSWPPPRGVLPAKVESSRTANNGLSVTCGGMAIKVWLSPSLVDFQRRVNLTINGRRVSPSDPNSRPNLDVLLEDVRTRGDRQHPFWARVEVGR